MTRAIVCPLRSSSLDFTKLPAREIIKVRVEVGARVRGFEDNVYRSEDVLFFVKRFFKNLRDIIKKMLLNDVLYVCVEFINYKI